MRRNKTTKRIISYSVLGALIVASLFAAVKLVLFGFLADDSFLVTMPYRLATGEKFFEDLWETVQFSGVLCAVLERIYLFVSGTTEGLVIYLRICGVIIHFIVSIVLFSTLSHFIKREYALLVVIIFFNMSPKVSAIPEYNNMLIWFTTLSICLFVKAYEEGSKKSTCILFSGIFFGFAVLAYPSAVLLVPAYIICFFILDKKQGIRDCLIFFGICAFMALGLILYLVITVDTENLIDGIKHTFLGDSTHLSGITIQGQGVVTSFINGAKTILLHMLVVWGFACSCTFLWGVLSKKTRVIFDISLFLNLAIIGAAIESLYCWLWLKESFDIVKIHIPIVVFCGLMAVLFTKKEKDISEKALVSAFVLGCLVLFAVAVVSNVPIVQNMGYLQVAVAFGLPFVLKRTEGNNIILCSLVALGICVIVGQGYSVKSTPLENNISVMTEKMELGVAKGVYVTKEYKDILTEQIHEFREYTVPGDRILIIQNNYSIPISSLYLENNVIITHYNTTSTPTYDTNIWDYWNRYNDKIANVVVVDKAYDDLLMFREDSMIYNYIQEYYYLDKSDRKLDFYRRK